MCIFAILTYQNLHRTIVLAEQRVDRQILKMTFLQIILTLVFLGLLGVFQAYKLFTTNVYKDQNQVMIEYFAYTIVSTESTFYYTVCLYIVFLLRIFC
ncbi:hypothetical protein I4U23_005584 [Adineta vaga]|nr:hypothetical protein I4U23_005584 [Adineta vaga]